MRPADGRDELGQATHLAVIGMEHRFDQRIAKLQGQILWRRSIVNRPHSPHREAHLAVIAEIEADIRALQQEITR